MIMDVLKALQALSSYCIGITEHARRPSTYADVATLIVEASDTLTCASTYSPHKRHPLIARHMTTVTATKRNSTALVQLNNNKHTTLSLSLRCQYHSTNPRLSWRGRVSSISCLPAIIWRCMPHARCHPSLTKGWPELNETGCSCRPSQKNKASPSFSDLLLCSLWYIILNFLGIWPCCFHTHGVRHFYCSLNSGRCESIKQKSPPPAVYMCLPQATLPNVVFPWKRTHYVPEPSARPLPPPGA